MSSICTLSLSFSFIYCCNRVWKQQKTVTWEGRGVLSGHYSWWKASDGWPRERASSALPKNPLTSDSDFWTKKTPLWYIHNSSWEENESMDYIWQVHRCIASSSWGCNDKNEHRNLHSVDFPHNLNI